MPPVPYSPTATSVMAAPSPSSGTPRRFEDSDDGTNKKKPQRSNSILTNADGSGGRLRGELSEQALPPRSPSPLKRLAPSAKDTPSTASKEISLSPSSQRRGKSTQRLMGTIRSVFSSVDVQLRSRCAAPQATDDDDDDDEDVDNVQDIDSEWRAAEAAKRRGKSPVDLRRHHQRRAMARSRSGQLTKARKGVASPNCLVLGVNSAMVDDLLEGVEDDDEEAEMKKRQAHLSRRRIAAIAAARSKRDPSIWGPTHSVDTEDFEVEESHQKQREQQRNGALSGATVDGALWGNSKFPPPPPDAVDSGSLQVTDVAPRESQRIATDVRTGDDETPPTIATTTSPPVLSVGAPENDKPEIRHVEASQVASEPLAQVASEPPAQVASEPPAQLPTEPPAQVASEPPAHVASEPPAQVASEPPAQVASEPPAAPFENASESPFYENLETNSTDEKVQNSAGERFDGTLSPTPGADPSHSSHDGNIATNAAALVTAAVVACSPEAERSLNKMWESAAAAMSDFLTPGTTTTQSEPRQVHHSVSQSSLNAQRRQFLRDWQQEESKGTTVNDRAKIVEESQSGEGDKETSPTARRGTTPIKDDTSETERKDHQVDSSGPRYIFSDSEKTKAKTDDFIKKGKLLAREEHVNGTDSVVSSSTAAEGSEPIEVIFEAMGDDGLKRRVHMSKTDGDEEEHGKEEQDKVAVNLQTEPLNQASGNSSRGGEIADDENDEVDRYHSVTEKAGENGIRGSDLGVEVAKSKSSTSSRVSKSLRINPRDTPTRRSNSGVHINSTSTDSNKNNVSRNASASPPSASKRSRGSTADFPRKVSSGSPKEARESNAGAEISDTNFPSKNTPSESSKGQKRPASAPPGSSQRHVSANELLETPAKADPGTDLLQAAADVAMAMFGGNFLGQSSEGQQPPQTSDTEPPPPPPPPPPPAHVAEIQEQADEIENKEQKQEGGSRKSKKEKQHIAPFETLEVRVSEMIEFERSISELTMRSSYGEATARLNESRRMAYYAVGKHHHRGGSHRGGGNRRCYFTGHVIVGGAPFYAGSVQQGLRTLVVFCLPVALGYSPNKETDVGGAVENSNGEAIPDVTSSLSATSSSPVGVANTEVGPPASLPKVADASGSPPTSQRTMGSQGGNGTPNNNNTSSSRLSSVDGTSYASIDSDERDLLLRTLPEPCQALLDEMKNRYPEQFNTLPVQVRSPHCWRLFVKFCFFSGLPIAEGEMHYKVRDEVALEVYGDEIILSHDVMEAVNGEQSADILRLPNKKTFKYLRKHYTQQSGKLPGEVFDRKSWELVRPEF